MTTRKNEISPVFEENWVDTSFDAAIEIGVKGFNKEDFAAVLNSLKGRIKHKREYSQKNN